jgi:hypothetical protein
VNETLEPSEDLTPFIDKLPKNRPTREQAQQIAQVQIEEAQKQKEKQDAEEYFTRAMQTIIENQKQQELIEAQNRQFLAQQQAYELAQAGIDINSLQSVGGEVETGQEVQAPPSQEEIEAHQEEIQKQVDQEFFNEIEEPID